MPWRARECRGPDADTITDPAARRAVAVRQRLAESGSRDVATRKSITNDVCRSVITDRVRVADRLGLADPVTLTGSLGLAERFAVADGIRIAHPRGDANS